MKRLLPLITLLAVGMTIVPPAMMTAATAKDVRPTTSSVTKADYLIQDGRVGKISKKTTKKDLIRLFGAANIEDFIDRAPEGTGNTPASHVKVGGKLVMDVLWKNSKRQQASSVRIYDSRWRTADGIAVGTKIRQLHQKFGTFKFSGFGWDYGGVPYAGNQKLDQYRQNQQVGFLLGLPEGTCRPVSKCESVLGDGVELTSADKVLTELNAQVLVLYVGLK
jgi:hypothetical protein